MLNSIFSKPYSRLYIVGDNADWVIDQESRELVKIGQTLGLKTSKIKRAYFNVSQFVHYSSQFSLNESSIYKSLNKISVDYFHGKPEQADNFRKCFESLKAHHEEIFKVRVSTKEMESVIKTSGIDPDKVMRIPIGINLDIFTPQTRLKKSAMRERLGIPEDALVIGSFQKDGVGWDEGLEPKLIKGPDIFLQVVEKLKKDFPNLFILLTGPARGYVKNGLTQLNIPYKHALLEEYAEVTKYYDTLDLYLITSREEGGPKAGLEAMAKCVPLVTTAVGQCRDLVINRENGMIVPIDNVEALYKAAYEVLTSPVLREKIIDHGLSTAAENSYEAQIPLWKEFFKL